MHRIPYVLAAIAISTRVALAEPVEIIDFADYGCEPCRTTSFSADVVASGDPLVSVERADNPFSGPEATLAAVVLISLEQEGVDTTLARRKMAVHGTKSLDELIVAAGGAVSRVMMNSSYSTLSRSKQKAEAVGLDGKPGAVVKMGDKIVVLHGGATVPDFQEAIKRLRSVDQTSSSAR